MPEKAPKIEMDYEHGPGGKEVPESEIRPVYRAAEKPKQFEMPKKDIGGLIESTLKDAGLDKASNKERKEKMGAAWTNQLAEQEAVWLSGMLNQGEHVSSALLLDRFKGDLAGDNLTMNDGDARALLRGKLVGMSEAYRAAGKVDLADQVDGIIDGI